MLSIPFLLAFWIINHSCNLAYATPLRLEPAYQNLVHPAVVEGLELSRSDTSALIKRLSPVRDQMDRSDCSIFAATALLEAELILNHRAQSSLLLSEEWLEYLVTRSSGVDGSDFPHNFKEFSKYGMPLEATLPYEAEDWPKRAATKESLARCGDLHGISLKACLVGHMDPSLLRKSDQTLLDPQNPDYFRSFVAARAEASNNRDQLFPKAHFSTLTDTLVIKELLRQGIPLVFEFDFFDGAWNHPGAAEAGITINGEHWRKGIVGYPEVGSVDRTKFLPKHEGHSVLLVGYDDTIEITSTQLMNNGLRRRFTYTGVYYFKNSWGEHALGENFELNGEKFPGYGMITQKYANEFGSFYQLTLE